MNIKEKNKERNVMPILPTGKIQGIFELNKRIGRSLEFFAFAQTAPAKNRDDSLLFSASPRGSLHRHSEYLAQAGRSMIEMLGVLAIVGALSVGGISGYSKAMLQYKVNKDIEIITQIVTNTQTLFAAQTGNCKYTGGRYECDAEGSCDCGYNTTFLPKLVLPEENSDDAEHLSPSGARIGVYWTAIYSEGELENDKTVNSRGFYIYLYNISQKECINLATYNWGSRTNGLIAYSVGEDVVADAQYNPDATYNCQGKIGDNIGLYSVSGALACPGGSVVGVPMPVSVAAEACNKCGDGCWMSFIFE